ALDAVGGRLGSRGQGEGSEDAEAGGAGGRSQRSFEHGLSLPLMFPNSAIRRPFRCSLPEIFPLYRTCGQNSRLSDATHVFPHHARGGLAAGRAGQSALTAAFDGAYSRSAIPIVFPL